MNMNRVHLQELAERIKAIEAGHASMPQSRFIDEPVVQRVPTGWAEVDAVLGGGLSADGLHEWFGADDPDPSEIASSVLVRLERKNPLPHGRGSVQSSRGSDQRKSNPRWTPPLCIMAHLAWNIFDPGSENLWTLWIGKRCHPYPRVLIRSQSRRLLDRSLFVAPPHAEARLWAIDLALRSPAVGCVIADGSDFDRAATQRIQLLAKTHAKMALAIRPSQQQDRLSAAQTRWRVGPSPPQMETPQTDIRPGWCVELLRCKGMRPTENRPMWFLEWNGSDGTVNLSARLAGVAGPAKTEGILVEPERLRQQSA